MPTIELDRYDPWSTYGTDTYEQWDDVNPVEAKGYDAELAFPHLKPDLGVLSSEWTGTRRQRGWYQIIQTRRGPNDLSSQRQQHRFATGADLPVELLPMIAGEVDTRSCDWPEKDVRKIGRRRIGLYASVCRDWAERFHAELFYNSIISSGDAIVALLALLRSSAGRGRLRRHMKYFVLWYDPSDPPWLHLMPSVYAFLSDTPSTRLSITGPLATPCPRSLHAKLPRSLPAFSSAISELSLTAVHFLRFDDLARLQCSLPHLTHLHARELTWGMPPALATSRYRISETGLEYIQLRNCTAIWPAALLIMLGRLRPSDEDCVLLGALGQAVEGEGGAFTSCWCGPPRLQNDSKDRFAFFFVLVHKDEATLDLTVSVTAQRRAHDVRSKRHAPTKRDCWEVVSMEISYKNKRKTRKWIPVRWDALDQVLSSFRHLECVTVVFKRYLEGSQTYADETLAMMPLVSRSGKLRLRWKERSPYSS